MDSGVDQGRFGGPTGRASLRGDNYTGMTYPIVNLVEVEPIQLEQVGTKTKFWYRDEQGKKVLFKEGRPDTGENWAEKVCCELCRLLCLPHAEYDLAVWKGTRKGVITPSFVPDESGARLVLGNELLSKIVDNYEKNKRYRASQHAIRIVMAAASLPFVKLPIGWPSPPEIKNVAGLFTGYLLLDALVGNQDRHHENWGIIFLPEQDFFLAPTFDHASSLGRNELDSTREEMLTTRDKGRSIESYVERAKSALFSTPSSLKPLTTLGAFEAAAKISPEAARYWVEKLAGIDPRDYLAVLKDIPDQEITEAARKFAFRMLELNSARIFQLEF